MAPGVPGGDTVFNCGKYRGQTFQYVVDNHRGYATWCMEQKNMRSQLRDFATFVRRSGIDVSCSQSVPCSQNTACSQATAAATQPPATFTTAGGAAVGAGAPGATQGGAAAAPSQPAASQPAPAPKAPAQGQVLVRGMSMGKAADPVTPPCKQARQDPMAGLQATPSPMPAAAVPTAAAPAGPCQASPAPSATAPAPPAFAGLGQCTPLPVPDSQPTQAAQPAPAAAPAAATGGEGAEAPLWSTGDKQLDAFLVASVDAKLVEKFVRLSETRRVAVARLLQARQGSVKNFQAYAMKVINTASQDSASTQDAAAAAATQAPAATPAADCPASQPAMTQAATQAMPGQAFGPLGPPDASQLPQQHAAPQLMCSQPAMPMSSQPAASQGAPMMSQMSQGFMPTQNTLCSASQASPMMGMPMQQQPGPMQPQMGPPPMQPQMGQPMQMQPGQMQPGGMQPGQMPMQGQMMMQQSPGQMVMQQSPGQMVMQQPPGPYGGQLCAQGMQGMPGQMMPAAPQMSPWARVLAHLESKGIAFADIKGCHFDTRRDVLKEVFAKEPLARAQAEMDWMKAKMNAVGSSGGSRPARTRSRSRDRMSQGPGRPGGSGAGISYIMRH